MIIRYSEMPVSSKQICDQNRTNRKLDVFFLLGRNGISPWEMKTVVAMRKSNLVGYETVTKALTVDIMLLLKGANDVRVSFASKMRKDVICFTPHGQSIKETQAIL